MAGQVFEFEAHAAAVAEERDLADLGRKQVFFVHHRVDGDRLRPAEQPAAAGSRRAGGQAHAHATDLGLVVTAALKRQPVTLAHELGHKGRGGLVVDFLRRGVLLDLAVVHHRDAVGHQHGLVLVVGDHQGGDTQLALQLAQLGAQVLANPRIQRRHRLIQQQQRRCRRQGTRQGHTLLLAARKLAGVLFFATGQANQLEHFNHPLARLLTATAHQAVGDVGFDGEVGKQRVGLEQDAVVAGLGWQLGDVALTDVQLAAVLAFEAGDAAQQRGLAATGWAEQAHQLARGDVQGDIVKRREGAEALVDIAHFHLCARGGVVHGRASSKRWGHARKPVRRFCGVQAKAGDSGIGRFCICITDLEL
ncbi:hypothetical protein D3C76_504770 [compost metagenome]